MSDESDSDVDDRPFLPSAEADIGLHAWELLSRPAGCSIRRLRAVMLSRGVPVPYNMASVLAADDRLCVYVPLFRQLPPLSGWPRGRIFSDGRKHAYSLPVRCAPPGPLANPWPVLEDQTLEEAVRLCSCLMLYGGRAADWGGQVSDAYRLDAADSARESELMRLASLVAAGASVSLLETEAADVARRISSSYPSIASSVADAIQMRVDRATSLQSTSVPSSPPAASVALSSTGAADAVRRGVSLHVRRSAPPLLSYDPQVAPSSLPVADLAASRLQVPPVEDAASRVLELQPLAFAGAALVYVPPVQHPAAFSHRMLDPRPAHECFVLPFPVANQPAVRPTEAVAPSDPPSDLLAYDVHDVVPHNDLRRYKHWARRARRSCALAKGGHGRRAQEARPPDLCLVRSHAPFQGVVMDFSVYPFRPLLPTRWPDRPPSTDLRIRAFRREFQCYPSYPDRQLRGAVSHGIPEVGACSDVSFFAAPHASVYQHHVPWAKQVTAEFESGWGQSQFARSFGLATWPQRIQPTSMVERNGKWRLCHDMSWPQPGGDVESPNSADELVMSIVFVTVSTVCTALAIYLSADLPVAVAYFDLSKAYKRTGQQGSSRWRRTFWAGESSQTLDRTCFGQTDGPSEFSCQTGFMTFVMRQELAYSERCYPTRDPRVVAFVLARQRLTPSAASSFYGGHTPASSLSFVTSMIDDFGLVMVDDDLFRLDGSAVFDDLGVSRTRAWLAFAICTSVAYRFGHILEPDDPGKYHAPSPRGMLYLGTYIDVQAAERVFDSAGDHSKRARYTANLRRIIDAGSVSASDLMSVAFQMLVVCECHPMGRQWLHPIFRSLRGHRTSRVDLSSEPQVAQALGFFFELLSSGARLAVPLLPRCAFPFADAEYLMVAFADASGPPPPGVFEPGSPGGGAWTVRGRVLYFFDNLWTSEELRYLNISVLEFLVSFWAEVIFSRVSPSATHGLSFTDNTGAEWSMRRETPYAALMQRVSARRSCFLAERRLFVYSYRVTSGDNRWADMLSRQRRAEVLAEAAALGLTVVDCCSELADLRDTAWLTSVCA